MTSPGRALASAPRSASADATGTGRGAAGAAGGSACGRRHRPSGAAAVRILNLDAHLVGGAGQRGRRCARELWADGKADPVVGAAAAARSGRTRKSGSASRQAPPGSR